MKLYSGIAEAADAMRAFFYVNQAALPEGVRERLQGAVGTGSSPIDLAVAFVEFAYANRADVPVQMLEIAAGVGLIIVQFGFHGSLDGRADGIVAALRRDSGEDAPAGVEWPDPESDPAVNDRYREPEPASAPAPVPAPVEQPEG